MTDRAPVYPRVLDERVPSARHVVEHHANNVVEADHGRLKARLRPMRGLNACAQPRISRPGTRSYRTFDAATTNSLSTDLHMIVSASPSLNSPPASDTCPDHPTVPEPALPINATEPLGVLAGRPLPAPPTLCGFCAGYPATEPSDRAGHSSVGVAKMARSSSDGMKWYRKLRPRGQF